MREDIVKEWFYSWFNPQWDNFKGVFENDIYYSESWGPEYYGIEEIEKWVTEWHQHSKLVKWDIKQIIPADDMMMVEWTFSCSDINGVHEFDGVSLIEWSKNNKIKGLKEFASELPKYNPFTKRL